MFSRAKTKEDLENPNSSNRMGEVIRGTDRMTNRQIEEEKKA